MRRFQTERHVEAAERYLGGARRARARPLFLRAALLLPPRLRLTLVEVMSIMTSWKAAVSSACRWVCSAIFSLNFRGFEAPDPEPEVGPGPGPQPPVPVADIFTERTGRPDVVERFSAERRRNAKSSHSAAASSRGLQMSAKCCAVRRRVQIL